MADFSADKQALQKTLAVFDTDVKVEDVVGYSTKYEPYQSTDVLFLQTILEVCCSFVEPNPNQRKHLFTVLEALLVREKIINPNIRFESLTDIRRKSAKQFIVSLNELRSSLIPSPKDSIAIPKLLDVDHTKKYPNTYEENFVELRVIAEGGFGTVCMARHKVDGLIYAIKKIIFNFEREKDFTKVMSEVKSISTLSHKNIVSYKNCWIQLPYNLEESTGVAEEGYSESLHSVSQKFSGIHHGKGKPKCATILNFDPIATSSPCSQNTKSLKECLLQRVLSLAHNTRVSRSIRPNKSPKSCSSSVFDRTIDTSKSETDRSIICDLPSDNFAQGSVLAGPSIIITDSASNNSTASAESWMSSLDHETELDQRNVWSSTPSSLVSTFANLDIKSSPLSISTDSWVNNSSHDRTIPELQSDDGILFSDSYRNDSLDNLTSTSDGFDNPLSVSNNETLSADSGDSNPEDSSSDRESVQSVVFRDSFENSSVENSVLSNGDFSESVDVSRCKTSSVTSCSTLNQTQSTANDSVVCYDSTRNASSLDYPYKFKIKFRAMLCIQMEYCDCDLRLWMDQKSNGASLPFQKDIKDIFKEIVKGVAYIHSKSIIHRDLKPQNIFYSEKDNSMKIGDFGLATLGHSSPNRHRVVNQHFTSDLGTYPYAAPEQMRKHDYDNKVDIYSLGIILIELLLPFRTRSEFFHTIPLIVRGDMPKELTSQWPCYVKLVENLVQKRPTFRMTAREILDLPVMQDDAEVDRRLLVREIEDLKKALEDKDKEFEDALNGKNAIIESLRHEIKELSSVVKNLKSKKSRKKH